MIPILIPIKEFSERCPQKNEYLLDYTVSYLNRIRRSENVWVISESKKLLDLATRLGVKTFQESLIPGQNEKHACWKFLKENTFENAFICPVTQPFRDLELFDKAEKLYEEKKRSIDFVTSVTLVPNREQFFVEMKDTLCDFTIQRADRTGVTCLSTYMIDGALYLINCRFLGDCVESDHCTNHFWNGKFAGVINNAPFIDIDTKDDLKKFEYLENYFENIRCKRTL